MHILMIKQCRLRQLVSLVQALLQLSLAGVLSFATVLACGSLTLFTVKRFWFCIKSNQPEDILLVCYGADFH